MGQSVIGPNAAAGKQSRTDAPEQSVLYSLTDRLFRARTLDQIHEAALDAICEGLRCTRASILRFDAAGVMRFVAWRGLSEGYRTAVDGHSPWRRDDRDAEPICVEDIGKSDQPEQLNATILNEGIQALAFIPLASADALIGKFMIYYDTPHVFCDQERDLALTIARQLGFAIERHIADRAARRLVALVESSQDAIIAKDLDGTITDWNGGAERLFGHHAVEAIGQSVMFLVPPDRQDEEQMLLARIRAGERIEEYETVRQRKDGSRIDISLTVSPIKDFTGKIVGVSSIARDITERRRADEKQQLLLREMDHRVKNLFALATSIVNVSARSATSPEILASEVSQRLATLSRAHALTIPLGGLNGRPDQGETTLHTLIGAMLEPYKDNNGARAAISGIDLPLPSTMITPLSLMFYELATNAAKYGSLSAAEGAVEIDCFEQRGDLVIVWREIGGPPVHSSREEGFGSRLFNAAARQLGTVNRVWDPTGLLVELHIECARFPGIRRQSV